MYNFKKGHILKASELQEIAEYAARILNINVSPPLEISSGPEGIHISAAFIPGGERAFFKTQDGPDSNNYPPAASNPTVYHAHRVDNVSFTETIGQQELTYDDVDDSDTFIFNLASDDYIEEGSVVICFRENDQWFTIDKVQTECMTPCPACEDYANMPRQWEMTISGITNGADVLGNNNFETYCVDLNGDFVLTKEDNSWSNGYIYCHWVTQGNEVRRLCFTNEETELKWGLVYDQIDDMWYVHATFGCQIARYSMDPDDFDCYGPNTLAYDCPTCSGNCNTLPATVTITPL